MEWKMTYFLSLLFGRELTSKYVRVFHENINRILVEIVGPHLLAEFAAIVS